MTTAEAADRLGLTVRAVQKMIEVGRLAARKVGRDYLIAPSALENIPKQAAGRPPKQGAPAPEKRATAKQSAGKGTTTGKPAKKRGRKAA